MADLGLQGAYGNAGMAAAIRQRIFDQLTQQADAQNMDLKEREEQRAEQEAQDTAAYRRAQLQTLADQRDAIAAQRNAQALKLRTDSIPMGAVLSPTDAATLPDYLKQHQDAVLGSTAIGGVATTPDATTGSVAGALAPASATPTPIQGSLQMIPQAAHGAQDVYTGTAAQQDAKAQQDAIEQAANDPNTPAPVKQFLRGRLIGVNIPGNLLTPTAPKLMPVKTVDAQGNPVTQFVDPSQIAPGQTFKAPKNDTSYGSVLAGLMQGADPKLTAQAIMNGDQPPDTTTLNRYIAPAVSAELERHGYDLSKAASDWKATQHYLATLNGASQVRLRQAVQFASDSLPKLQQLSDAWSRGNFPPLNHAQLVAARNGLLGPQAQQIATNLDNQLTELQSELAVVYRGGNAPTDQAFQSAAKVLSSDWSGPQLASAIKLVQQNIGYRLNSIKQAGIVASPGNVYGPKVGQPSGAVGGDATPSTGADLVYDPKTKTFTKAGGQ